MNKIVIYWMPPALWAVLIYILSSSSSGASSLPIPDYVLHASFFGVLALLIYRGLINSGFSIASSVLVSIIGAVIYGVVDEIHQSFVPGRDAALSDVMFDTIGAVIIILFIWKLLPKAPPRLKHWGRRLGIM